MKIPIQNKCFSFKRLQNVVSGLQKTRLIEMKPIDAIKQTLVKQGFSQPVKDYEEIYLMLVRRWDIFYESDELEGYRYGGEKRKRSTDPIWSVDVYKIKDRYIQKHQPTLYYLDGGPKQKDPSFLKSCNPFRIFSY